MEFPNLFFEFLYNMLIVLITYGYIFATILIPVQLKKKGKLTKFQARKFVHLFAGLSVLSTPFFTWPWLAIIIAGSLTVLTYLSSRKSRVKRLKELYESIGEEAEEKKGRLEGPFHYCLSITILISIFVFVAPNQLYFPIAGILLMIISDTLASLVGKKYGKIKIELSWTKTVRTLEGSLVFLGSGFLLCFFAFLVFSIVDTQIILSIEQVLLYSLITSSIATIVELLSPSTWDDFTVPIVSTLIIYLLTLI